MWNNGVEFVQALNIYETSLRAKCRRCRECQKPMPLGPEARANKCVREMIWCEGRFDGWGVHERALLSLASVNSRQLAIGFVPLRVLWRIPSELDTFSKLPPLQREAKKLWCQCFRSIFSHMYSSLVSNNSLFWHFWKSICGYPRNDDAPPCRTDFTAMEIHK